MRKDINKLREIKLNEPLYLYQQPMFMVTASVVPIWENGVLVVEHNEPVAYSFPTGVVKAGQETVQFAAVRHVKEQTGIVLTKETLIPVDFRSDPDRSESGNALDIGFLVFLDVNPVLRDGSKWVEVNFSEGNFVKPLDLYMDQWKLLKRALEVTVLMRED